MKKIVLLLLIGSVIGNDSFGQEDLPKDFSVLKVGKRVVVSWTHNFPSVKMISVQRSYDSSRYFQSIGAPPDPNLKDNGVSDPNPPNDSMYYRVYVLLEGSRYVMTKAKRPMVDTSGVEIPADVNTNNNPPPNTASFLPAGFTQSRYIFMTPDRYIRVELPMDSRKYDIKFFTESYQPLFELKGVKEKRFKLDRSYFYKAGYVNFELYADGKILEKYKLFLPKDF
ncbi:hypothetical protein SAMN04487894_109107 [Niabella drilacis]|uniref:Uncharacterized protein n=1 Tax=Niabella drilacis (strain DSM 25811 / CCM 8410 / CCUG 62505 / LMG 26954 / E90) TaxID=1285928 RepID=A0A1G6UXV8_NIADE|nr:hypothetical protein SAMN04487894_109107 [Niabella drilacis]